MKPLEGMRQYAPVTLRLGMSFVFLWFGLNQFFNPAAFLGYLPPAIFESSFAHAAVIANGIFEVVFGLLLALGLYTRITAAILALHLLVITIELGDNDIAIRDIGLTTATIAIALGGADIWCLETRLKQKKAKK